MAIKKEVKSFIIGTAAGAAIGAVTALLFAPKPGKELRKDIADGAQHAYEATAKKAGQVSDATVRIAKQVGSQTAELAGRAKEAVSGVVGTVTSLRSKSVEAVEGEGEAAEEAATETEQENTISAVS